MTTRAFNGKFRLLYDEWVKAPKAPRRLDYGLAVETIQPGDIAQVMWCLERVGVYVSVVGAFEMAYYRRCVLGLATKVNTSSCVTRKGDKAGTGQRRD